MPPIVWVQSTHPPMPAPESRPTRLRIRTTAVAALVLTLGYLLWRATSTLDGASWWLAAPMLVLEVYSLVSLITHTAALWDLDAGPTPETRRETNHRIAVLIATYNEPYEILLPTVAAAVAMQLPHETWVLDDGDRPWVAEIATQLGARYTTREGSAHAKAGNINALLPQLDVDLIAVLDADHVARTDFLKETVGYFDDPKVALVQTPQDFYNVDSFEHVQRRSQRRFGEQELFYRGLAAGRNRWNAAFWCGTNAVVRLEALRAVGGVAVETVTEDIHTTIRLHRKGWRTVYHNAVLARGLAASDSDQYLSQRLRWGTGAMQVLRTENPATVSGLSMMQRVSYLSTLCGWFDSWRTLAYVMLPAVVLLTAGTPIAAPALTFLVAFGVIFAAQQLALWALARGHAPPLPATLFEFIRMPANLRATMTLFSRRRQTFTVTAKGRQADERSRMRAPRLLIALLIGSLLAGAWYVASVLGWTPLTYPTPWVAHGAAFWLLVNFALLVQAVRRIRHERFAPDRRAAVRFELPGVVFIDDDAACPLRDVSLTGASVLAPEGLLHAGQRCRIDLDVAGIMLGLDVLVRNTVPVAEGDVVGLEFERLDVHAHATLALALFATGVEPTLVEATAVPVG
jgi:cellulose synthase (UDP-forming)